MRVVCVLLSVVGSDKDTAGHAAQHARLPRYKVRPTGCVDISNNRLINHQHKPHLRAPTGVGSGAFAASK